MLKNEDTQLENCSDIEQSKSEQKDPLARAGDSISLEIPPGVDRRTFLMRSAVIGATAVITGREISAQERRDRAMPPAPK